MIIAKEIISELEKQYWTNIINSLSGFKSTSLVGTIFIVGENVEIILLDDIVAMDDYINIEKGGTIAISGLDNYHETRRIARLAYAMPGVEPKELWNEKFF